jgi:phenylpropionate dioxygenase-like ring-hydroxylating dioxygenase large terminal subunit
MNIEQCAPILQQMLDWRSERTTQLAESTVEENVSMYLDADVLDNERNTLFRKLPLFMAFSAEMPKPGDYIACDDSGTPILLMRDDEGAMHAYLNACMHRGVPVISGRGHAEKLFSCPFHGWTYERSGGLKSMPFKQGFEGMSECRKGLTELPCAESAGMVFVVPDVEGRIDIDAWLGELGPEIASWGTEGMFSFAQLRLERSMNWKAAVDTFKENYHFATLHSETLINAFHSNLTHYTTFGPHHRMVFLLAQPPVERVPEGEWNPLQHLFFVYFLFPHTVLFISELGAESYRMYPGEAPGKAVIHRSQLNLFEPTRFIEEGAFNAQIEATMRVFAEDFAMADAAQASFARGGTETVVLGRNEPALQHWHAAYRDAMSGSGFFAKFSESRAA